MSNISVSKENKNGIDVLRIEIPINKRPSKSGKNMVIASTNGNVHTDTMVDGKVLTLGVNAYVSKD